MLDQAQDGDRVVGMEKMSDKHVWHVTIRRNADMAVRVCDMNLGPWKGAGDEYWFEEGNWSCDCNRMADFLRAGGEEEPDDVPCGDDGYTILGITQDDDPTILYYEDP